MKSDGKRNYTIGRNPEEQHKKTRSSEGIGKKRWSSIRGQQSGIYGRNIYVLKNQKI